MDAPRTGLTSKEVAERIASGDVNRTERSTFRDYAQIGSRNVVTLFNVLVTPAAIALFILDEIPAALAVSGMAITNTILGLAQEIRAKIHLERLTLLAETQVRVVRDGSITEIPSSELVRDEVVLLEAGEPILADGVVLEADYLEVDEALLTGESDALAKKAGDALLSGSYAVAGKGAFRVEKVGSEGFAQKLSGEARSYRHSLSPTQASINGLLQILTFVTLLLIGIYFVMYWWATSIPLASFVKMSAATLTSMIPQGLVLMATLAFVLGAVRMSRRGALAQELGAIETMARIDTLCMDKTGTLTTNRLKMTVIVTLGDSTEDEVHRRLGQFASASGDNENKTLQALRAGVEAREVEVIDRLPFKSQNRYSALRIREVDADSTLVLGAPEALAPLLEEKKSDWRKPWEELVERGLRLLLFAEALEGSDESTSFGGSLVGYTLKPLALLAFQDELRPEAGEVLEHLAEQGIAFKIISGDHPETVRSTLRPLAEETTAPALRHIAEAPIATGAELENSEQVAELIADRSVFGRVSPWQKVQIVEALKERGHQVAMIGDGVNDVLPIKNAQLGIAMGAGSRVSKTVAGLVLQNNSFALLPETLEEGRTILFNLRRASKLFLVKNVYMLILIVGSIGILGLPFPFEPQQVTLLNFLTIGLPALIITWSRTRAVRAVETSFLEEVGGFAMQTGIVLGGFGLLIYGLASRVWHYEGHIPRSMLLTTLVVLGLITLVRVLWDRRGSRSKSDGVLIGLAVVAIPFYLGMMYFAPTATFFALSPLTLVQWGLCLAGVSAATIVLLVWDRMRTVNSQPPT